MDSANKLRVEAEGLKEVQVKLQRAESALEDTKKQLAAKTVQIEQLVSSLDKSVRASTKCFYTLVYTFIDGFIS